MWRVLVVVLAGCGRIGFDPFGPPDGIAADIAPAPFDQPFGPPQLIAEIATADEDDDPSLTGDMLELYFASRPGGGADTIFVSTRSSVTEPWSPPQTIPALNMGGTVNNPKVTADGLAIYFSSSRTPNMGGTDLWRSTRPDRLSAWSTPAPVSDLASAVNDYEPYALSGELVLYFTMDPANNPATYRSSRASTAQTWSAPIAVPGVDQPGYDGSPWVTADELGIMFHSGRSGTTTLYRAVRSSAAATFGTPVALSELDMAGNEEDAWLSPDGHTLYFSADPTGQADIYMATR